MMRRAVSLFAIALVGLGLACGTSPTPRFYALPPLEDPGALAEFADLGVAIGPVNLPRYLDEPQIATRKGKDDSRVQYRAFDRWAGGSLEFEVLRVLGENLGQLLGSDRVVVYPLTGPFPVKYRLRLDVERFDGRRGDSVELRTRWVLVEPDSGDAVAVETFDASEPLDEEKKTRLLVAAHGKLLGDLSRQVAERIVQLEDGR